ncbi:hypothetical protein TWF730_006055 [Orbilia blumenaviensis]|uniref:Uncharacterized protein n=1 Tax=Orbilia blumenaviensis TaxID=1796055 RepID=A0AAV9VLB0_9PEZI
MAKSFICGSVFASALFAVQGEGYILSLPIWNQYIQKEWNNLEAIGRQIDNLKYTITFDCPVGGPLFLPTFAYNRSLLSLLDILGEARVAFELSFAKMNQLSRMMRSQGLSSGGEPTTDLPLVLQEMLDNGWDQLWPNDEIKSLLSEIQHIGTDSVINAMRISDYINDIPGWERRDDTTDQNHIDRLARLIDSNGVFTVGGAVEGIIVGPQPTRKLLTTQLSRVFNFLRFHEAQFRSYAKNASISMANPALLEIIRKSDPNYGAGEEPFTFADLFANIAKWFSCWVPEFQDLLYLIEKQLGSVPEPEVGLTVVPTGGTASDYGIGLNEHMGDGV